MVEQEQSALVQLTREYIVKNKVRVVIQDAINKLLETRSEDVAGVLSRIIKQRAHAPVIEKLVVREVLDSRENPTVEVEVYLYYLGEVKFYGRSSAPTGESTGQN
jgi:enolase